MPGIQMEHSVALANRQRESRNLAPYGGCDDLLTFTAAPISRQLAQPYSRSMTDEAPPPQRGAELASPAGLRASHMDRDRAVEQLRVAAGDGRLTAEELDERLEAALTARTYGELAALTTDLPAVPDSAPGPPAPEPKDLARIDCRGSSVKRDGRWLVPKRMEVRVTGGSVTLDFTDAVIVRPSLLLDADVSAGRLTLVTKPGVVVDTEDVAAEGSYLKVQAHPVPKCRPSCGSRCPARSAAATSRHARHAGPSGRGCGAIPSPAGLPHPDLTAMTDPGPLFEQ